MSPENFCWSAECVSVCVSVCVNKDPVTAGADWTLIMFISEFILYNLMSSEALLCTHYDGVYGVSGSLWTILIPQQTQRFTQSATSIIQTELTGFGSSLTFCSFKLTSSFTMQRSNKYKMSS